MSKQVIDFIHDISWHDLPAAVKNQARRCLLDIIGAAVGGRKTDLSGIICEYAARNHAGKGALIWFDGREVSPPGAALANGMTIDSLDIHDGHSLVKGHAGAAIIPAVFAVFKFGKDLSGSNLLTSLVVGYEVGLRAGLALHQTACDYHTSGAWNALGCAAVTARYLGLSKDQTHHALGIAEYHGPRSQMMRCIDHPTMVKDGSGWGAMAGVSAGFLAGAGFTGGPAITVESDEAADLWEDIGVRWRMLEQYFKPYAVCRWAQPAITGAMLLKEKYQIAPEDLAVIRVHSFYEAVQLNCYEPATTEEAQYSLPFPLAAAYIFGSLGSAALSGSSLSDPVVLSLANKVLLFEEPLFTERFPAKRIARVEFETLNGMLFDSGEVEPGWESNNPPSDDALRSKFRWLSSESLSDDRVVTLENMIWNCQKLDNALVLEEILSKPLENFGR